MTSKVYGRTPDVRDIDDELIQGRRRRGGARLLPRAARGQAPRPGPR